MPASTPVASPRLTRRFNRVLGAVLNQLEQIEASPERLMRMLHPQHRENVERLVHTAAVATSRQLGPHWRLPLPPGATWRHARDSLALALKALLVALDRQRLAQPAVPRRRRRRVRYAEAPLGPVLPLPFIPEPVPEPPAEPEPAAPPERAAAMRPRTARPQPAGPPGPTSRIARTQVRRLGLAGESVDMREQHSRSILGW